MSDFSFGAGSCCGKPVGCTNRSAGCQWPQHPWKRAVLDGSTTVRCQAVGWANGVCTPENRRQCVLRANHEGAHVSESAPPTDRGEP